MVCKVETNGLPGVEVVGEETDYRESQGRKNRIFSKKPHVLKPEMG